MPRASVNLFKLLIEKLFFISFFVFAVRLLNRVICCVTPDPIKRTVVERGASNYAIGTCISQPQEGEKVIAPSSLLLEENDESRIEL